MQVAKIFGRFNVKVVRYDVGVGGEQEFDTNDYLAALSFMKSDFNRELLYRMYWPAGAKMSLQQLLSAMHDAVMSEYRTREVAMLDATLSVAMQGSCATQMYARAHARRFPSIELGASGDKKTDPRYKRLCAAALTELFTSEICKTCKGRAEFVDADENKIECAACLGTGRKEWSDRRRSKEIGISHVQYAERGWNRAYLWAVRAMLSEADDDYIAALGSDWN